MGKYDETIKALSEDVSKSNRRKMKDGTVIRFRSSNDRYTYAAIYAGGRFWITGTGTWYGGNVFDYEEFVERVLGTASKIEVATAFEELR